MAEEYDIYGDENFGDLQVNDYLALSGYTSGIN
jgi:hypothetical protein